MADKQKILIVDDDNNIAELISLYLVRSFEAELAKKFFEFFFIYYYLRS